MKRGVAVAIACGYLALVTAGVGGHKPRELFGGYDRLSDLFVLAAHATGANTTHRYFAPGVASQLRIKYQVLGENGQPMNKLQEFNASNQEVSLRLGNLVDQFFAAGTDENDEKSRVKRAIASSFAAKILDHHSEANAARIKVEALVLPSMRGYRQGKTMEWDTHYDGVFRKSH